MTKIEALMSIMVLILAFIFTSLPENECKKIEKRAIAFLDGEPTTADEFNEDCMITYINEGDDIEYKYKEVGKRITFDKI